LAILSENVVNELRRRLAGLKNPVNLIAFTQEMDCKFCQAARELVQEVATISEKFSVTMYDLFKDTEKVNAYGIDKVPAISVEGEKDSGIRFFGLPSGHEFGSFLEAANIVSRNNAMLAPETLEILEPLNRPVHIQVFVTPSCPYCPIVVKTAIRFAFAKEQIRADMVDTTMFPHLTSRYAVLSVPKVVINESFSFEGAVPEREFAERLMKAVQSG
jgi:glutaredoxin-like protein